MIKSRAQLKELFKNGSMPTASSFAALIDSLVQEDEFAQFVKKTDDALAQRPEVELGDFPQATQWLGEAGRLGLYDPSSANAQKMPPASSLVKLSASANGKWSTIIPAVNGCFAFEVVASASGAKNANNHATTHAIVVSSFSGGFGSIRQTQAYSGWRFCRRIRLAWSKNDDGSQDLQIKTCCDYGVGPDGNPARIYLHITRLW